MNLSKLKNTAFTFKILTYLFNEAILKNDAKLKLFIENIINKYFAKSTEIYKELKIYKTIEKTQKLNEGQFNVFFYRIIYDIKTIDVEKISKEKYNLVKEFRDYFSDEELKNILNYRINEYKLYQSIFNLLNYISNQKKIKQDDMKKSLKTLEEHLKAHNTENKIIVELTKLDEQTRKIAVPLLIEKFNKENNHLSKEQKNLLNKYIIFGFTNELKNYIHKLNEQINKKLNEEIDKYKEDKKTWIKLKELKKQYNNIINENKLNEKLLLNMLRALELIKLL